MFSRWSAVAVAAAALVAPGLANAQTTERYGFFGGITAPEDTSASISEGDASATAELSTDSGFVVGGTIGVGVDNWTFEGELSYRQADLDRGRLSVVSPDLTGTVEGAVDGTVSATTLMANVWYSFMRRGNFIRRGQYSAYVGGGIGYAFADAEGQIPGVPETRVSGDSNELAWQVGAGVRYETLGDTIIGLGYRHFVLPDIGDTSIDVETNDVVVEVIQQY